MQGKVIVLVALLVMQVLSGVAWASHDATSGPVGPDHDESVLPFGEVLTPGSVDEVAMTVTTGIEAMNVCFNDESGFNAFNAVDPQPLYLVLGECVTVPENALRLSSSPHGEAGTKVQAGDADHGGVANVTAGFGYAFRYVDVTGTGLFTIGDTLYLATCGAPNCTPGESVAAGWLRITGHPGSEPGSFVRSGDPGVGEATTLLPPSFADGRAEAAVLGASGATNFAYRDLNRDGVFNGNDVMYLHVQTADGAPAATAHLKPREVDVRLGAFPQTAGFGEVLAYGHPDVVPTTKTAGIPAMNLCFRDFSGTFRYDPGDPVYMVLGACGAVPVNALRLTETNESLPAGTKVRPGDADMNAPSVGASDGASFGFTFRYVDRDSNNLFTVGDALYVATCNTSPGCEPAPLVDAGWVRVTAFDNHRSGFHVSAGDADVGLNTTRVSDTFAAGQREAIVLGGSGATNVAYRDLNGDGTFNGNDVMYLHLGSAAEAPAPEALLHPRVHEVRLGILPDTGEGYGETLTLITPDSVAATVPEDVVVNVCYVDENGDRAYDAGEPLYFTLTDCEILFPTAVRLITARPPGSTVAAHHEDFAIDLVGKMNGNLSYALRQVPLATDTLDEGGTDAAYYLALCDFLPACGTYASVEPGWVRLTDFNTAHGAGSTVHAGDADANRVTAPLDGAFSFMDVNRDGVFTACDILYFRPDGYVVPAFAAAAMPVIGDVRLATGHPNCDVPNRASLLALPADAPHGPASPASHNETEPAAPAVNETGPDETPGPVPPDGNDTASDGGAGPVPPPVNGTQSDDQAGPVTPPMNDTDGDASASTPPAEEREFLEMTNPWVRPAVIPAGDAAWIGGMFLLSDLHANGYEVIMDTGDGDVFTHTAFPLFPATHVPMRKLVTYPEPGVYHPTIEGQPVGPVLVYAPGEQPEGTANMAIEWVDVWPLQPKPGDQAMMNVGILNHDEVDGSFHAFVAFNGEAIYEETHDLAGTETHQLVMAAAFAGEDLNDFEGPIHNRAHLELFNGIVEAGVYTVNLNDQFIFNVVVTEDDSGFEVDEDSGIGVDVDEVPGIGPFAVIALLGMASVVARRRRRAASR